MIFGSTLREHVRKMLKKKQNRINQDKHIGLKTYGKFVGHANNQIGNKKTANEDLKTSRMAGALEAEHLAM